MASSEQIKEYLAYWFQLGKGVAFQSEQSPLLPKTVIQGNHYSPEFEAAWQQILAESKNCYLEGTQETIAELLTPAWEINPCSRCAMPMPLKSVGVASLECPCVDVEGWPNTEIPQPRSPVDSQTQLSKIRDRLKNLANH
ncbi:hypothetical protein AB3R30_04645 [Leptolyngbyaceae cyanobacterium UHCC 1019]